MSEVSIPPLTLSDVAEFHQQLVRLDSAGLRLQLEDDTAPAAMLSQQVLPEQLNEIMARLVSRAGQSPSLEQIIHAPKLLPERYRLALETWHKCDRSAESLATLRSPVRQASEGEADLRYALLLPTIVLILIYCASFNLLLVTLPRMEAIYAQLYSPPSLPVRWLIAVRSAMPYWVPGIPLLLALVWFLLITGRIALPRWLPGRRQSNQYMAAAMIARNLATQLDQSPSTHSGPSSQPNESSTLASESSNTVSGQSRSPMLRWALTAKPPIEATEAAHTTSAHTIDHQQARRLRLVASLYETMQSIHAQQVRVGITLTACVLLGGGLTLMYALALFGPLVQLLKEIVGY